MARKKTKTEDDAKLLEHAFSDVDPLPGRKIKKKSPSPFSQKAKNKAPLKSYRPRETDLEDLRPPPQQRDLGHGDTPGVDKRSAQRLKRGQMKIEAKLDLHGHRQEEAHRALNTFLAGAQESGKRCVLVVTGKGYKGDGSVGVLRENVPRWLNQPPNRARILSFSYATPSEGGTGALYILLKRLR